MKGAAFVLIGLGGVLAYAAIQYGGVVPQDWNVCLFALGALSVFFWLTMARNDNAPPLPRWILWPLVMLPIYLCWQLLPLNDVLLAALSPARAEAVGYLAAVGLNADANPLSVLPSATLSHLLRVLAYLTVMLLVRELAWKWRSQPWVAVYPLVAVGAIEAALAVLQAGFGEMQAGISGTYVNRNHFAGLLEICLPFPLLFSVSVAREANPFANPRHGWALQCAAGASVFGLLLAGLLFSLSRMGFVSSFAALALVSAVLIRGRSQAAGRRTLWKRVAPLCAAGGLAGLACLLLPSEALIGRFANLAATENLEAAFRINLWADSLAAVSAYPLFGCGLGAFQPAFSAYKTGAPGYDIDYAHNDYLQLLAELGVVGFAIVAILLAGVVLILVRRLSAARHFQEKCLALGCLASLVAIGLHSLADFNLYIPANAFAAAWTAGVALAPPGGADTDYISTDRNSNLIDDN